MSRIGTSRRFSTNRLSARRLGALVVALASGVLMVLGSCLVAPAAHAATSVDTFTSAAQAAGLDISDQDADACASDLYDLDVQSGDIKNCKWAMGPDYDLTITYADLDASKMDSYKKSVESSFIIEDSVTKTSGGYEYGFSTSDAVQAYYFSDTSVFSVFADTTSALDTARSVAKSSGFDAPDPGTSLKRSGSSGSYSISSEPGDDSSDGSSSGESGVGAPFGQSGSGSSSGTKADGDASKGTGDSASAKDSSGKGMSTTAIVIIVVVAVLLVAGVIVIIVVSRRKPRVPQYPMQPQPYWQQNQYPQQGGNNGQYGNGQYGNGQYGPQGGYGRNGGYGPQGGNGYGQNGHGPQGGYGYGPQGGNGQYGNGQNGYGPNGPQNGYGQSNGWDSPTQRFDQSNPYAPRFSDVPNDGEADDGGAVDGHPTSGPSRNA